MKKILLFGFSFLLVVGSFAQTDDGEGTIEDGATTAVSSEDDATENHNSSTPGNINSLSVGPRFAMPLNTLDGVIENGIGASASVDFGITEHLAFTGSISFTRHQFTPNILGTGNSILTPLHAGFKYYIGENSGFYTELTLGIQKIKDNIIAFTDTSSSKILTGTSLVNLYSITPAIGYKYKGASFRAAYEFIPGKVTNSSYISLGLLLDIIKNSDRNKHAAEEH